METETESLESLSTSASNEFSLKKMMNLTIIYKVFVGQRFLMKWRKVIFWLG